MLRVDFVRWLEFYYQIEKMENGPPEYVIEDQDQLDAWLKQKRNENERREREMRASTSANKKGGHSKMKMI